MNAIDENDRLLFQQSVGVVVPLAHDNGAALPRAGPAPRLLRTRAIPAPPADLAVSSDLPTDAVQAGDVLAHFRPGVQRRLAQRLRRGQLPAESELDLHHATVEQAGRLLAAFLNESDGESLRCVRLIHGKGHRSGHAPVLKNHLNHWLRQIPEVLAFCSAPPHAGGTGALLVLLRRKRAPASGGRDVDGSFSDRGTFG